MTMRVSRILYCTLLLLLVASLNISALAPASPPAPGVDNPAPVGAGSLPPFPRDAHSTTGPQRPPWVEDVDASGGGLQPSLNAVVISGVPAYLWRHGCGPTAAGMVLGYWDHRGFEDLVPGDASTQTEAVQQMIASEGPASNYTDYCEPIDDFGDLLPDKSEDPIGDEHPDDCVADYMRTSQSRYGNQYGWSFYSDVGPSFGGYVRAVSEGGYVASVKNEYMLWAPMLTWDMFRAEIDAGRPMVLLVDTDGNGGTDHFVTAIGYDVAGGTRRYACLDTWDTAIRWAAFAPIAEGHEWGIYGATLLAFSIPPLDVMIQGPTTAQMGVASSFTAVVTPTTVIQPLTYVWQATDQRPITHTVTTITDTVAFTWAGPGYKTVSVQVSNEVGTVARSFRVALFPVHLYMPLQRRP